MGRESEREAILSLVRDQRVRLVTLTGPGGMGKTSLAISAATALLDAFEHGVWLVDLAPVADAGLVESTIAAALGSATDAREHLRDRNALLVLDNFEQVVAAAGVVAEILEACPGVSVLATSREPLRLRGEREFPLSQLDEEAAASLFRDRAAAVMPGFDADPAQLRELGRRLEGIPLAIELAAARVKLLTPSQMLERLDAPLAMLTGGARDMPERQRTLEATIAWSHGLLDAPEAELFARLSVFAGGWTLEAAEAVCDAELDVLQSLVDKSLVRFVDGRFAMLETIRAYALARLREVAGGAALHERHMSFYLALAERAEPELTGSEQQLWLGRLADEYENLRAALEWCSATPAHVPEGLRIGSSLVLFWFVRGPYREGIHWLDPLLEKSAAKGSAVRAGALWGAGLMWTLIGDGARAAALLEESLAAARALGDDSLIARALDVLGLLAFFGNDLAAARELFEASITHARTAGDEWCLTDALGTLGSIYPLQGEPELARSAGSEALAMARRSGDQQGLRMALFGLALAAFRRGDMPEARRHGEEGLGFARELDDRWFTPYFLWVLATVELETGEFERAGRLAAESLALARELEAPLMLVCALDAAADCARCEGDVDGATALLLEAEAVAATGLVPGSYAASAATALASLQASSGAAVDARVRLDSAIELARRVGDPWAEGRALTGRAALASDGQAGERDAVEALRLQRAIGDQIGVLTTTETLAAAAARAGDAERAAGLAADVDGLRAQLGVVRRPWALVAE